jgi:hypothetical protein
MALLPVCPPVVFNAFPVPIIVPTGVGHIACVNKPSFAGVSFDVQFQDGRRLNVGLQSDSVTFLQRLY